MCRRLCGPRLLWLWLLMWAGHAVLGTRVSMKQQENRTGTLLVQGHQANSSSNSTGQEARVETKGGKYHETSAEQTMMIQRALYVLVVVTALVVIYFVVRTIRMRRINRKNRKYGILNTNLENMEMRPLDQDDDDEDDTLFDVHHSRRWTLMN
ncbi:membrane protein FAM174A-like isoform X1 [Carcharodon carcharias]|uniref:membrane protein FAM174A-like isoform X1 n=2 Tax=Carcharodon carcharias TaxID=13397 RepID=UPI001B7EE899|nr:membrane protein FAM174A-like isoform X1 [Carcharodon carcharias]